MINRIWKSGNSLVCTIPREQLKYAGMGKGTHVQVEWIERGKIVIKSVEWRWERKGKAEGVRDETE